MLEIILLNTSGVLSTLSVIYRVFELRILRVVRVHRIHTSKLAWGLEVGLLLMLVQGHLIISLIV